MDSDRPDREGPTDPSLTDASLTDPSLTDAALASRLAREAGARLLAVRRRNAALPTAELKRLGDAEAQACLAAGLAAARPRDAVLSEEAADDHRRVTAERVWIVDPLDGTREFAEGRDDWAVHVALHERGELVAGAVALPALGLVLCTDPAPPPPARDPGAVLRLAVSRSRPPEIATIVAEALGAQTVPMGSAGYKVAAVVRGEADLYLHAGGQYEWDSAAPVAVARAAGLHASRLDGSPLRYNQANPYLPDVVVCRPDVLPDLRTALRQAGVPLARADNIHWQAVEVDRSAHSRLKGHRPAVVWFTGLSGAGKSAIANLVESRLHRLGVHTTMLDGDNVRHGLNKDLGFTQADRVENIRRVAEVARLMTDAGLVVLVSFISPFRAERRMARDLVPAGEFCEVFVDTPLQVAEERDVKGLYAKARRGELQNFTGIDSPYEPPEHPEVRIDTTTTTPEEAADEIVGYLQRRGLLD